MNFDTVMAKVSDISGFVLPVLIVALVAIAISNRVGFVQRITG